MYSPIIKQYLKIKSNYVKELVLFRVGDFYELFFDDAKKASLVLNIVLTKRKSLGKKILMAGFPHHVSNFYITKLLKNKYTIVICEQVPTLDKKIKLIDRRVARILTPSNITSEFFINNYNKSSFIVCIYNVGNNFGVSMIDFINGFFFVYEISKFENLITCLYNFNIIELIISSNFKYKEEIPKDFIIRLWSYKIFDYTFSIKLIKEHFNILDLSCFGIENLKISIVASGVLLDYILSTNFYDLSNIKKIELYNYENYIEMNLNTKINLDIINYKNKLKKNSLFGVLNETITVLGGRKLFEWINKPLKSKIIVNRRLNVVDFFIKDDLYIKIRDLLKTFYDIDRIITRISMLSANTNDLIKLKNSLSILPDIKKLILKNVSCFYLYNKIINYSDIFNLIDKSISDSKKNDINNNFIIKKGFDEKLDIMKCFDNNFFKNLMNLEEKEKKKIEANNLKIKYKKNIGYFIEVSNSHLYKIPSDYFFLQKLKNRARYTNLELRNLENKILINKNNIIDRERKVFLSVLCCIKLKINDLQNISTSISELDVLSNFSFLSVKFKWNKPIVSKLSKINKFIIKGIRHPIVDQFRDINFIKNNFVMNDKKKMYIITGPNMSGKSTYMKSIAIVILMSYIGCFVAADKAYIGFIDKIFTRIGSSDDLYNNKSTFMVEMLEISNILNNATAKSLVVIDEIGRGTNILDGISLAWGCCIYLVNTINCFSLLSTHYMELTKLCLINSYIKLIYFDITFYENRLIFLYKLRNGYINKSFGIYVAKQAGLPDSIIDLAKKKLVLLKENEYKNDDKDN